MFAGNFQRFLTFAEIIGWHQQIGIFILRSLFSLFGRNDVEHQRRSRGSTSSPSYWLVWRKSGCLLFQRVKTKRKGI